jgi:hypothetical protein
LGIWLRQVPRLRPPSQGLRGFLGPQIFVMKKFITLFVLICTSSIAQAQNFEEFSPQARAQIVQILSQRGDFKSGEIVFAEGPLALFWSPDDGVELKQDRAIYCPGSGHVGYGSFEKGVGMPGRKGYFVLMRVADLNQFLRPGCEAILQGEAIPDSSFGFLLGVNRMERSGVYGGDDYLVGLEYDYRGWDPRFALFVSAVANDIKGENSQGVQRRASVFLLGGAYRWKGLAAGIGLGVVDAMYRQANATSISYIDPSSGVSVNLTNGVAHSSHLTYGATLDYEFMVSEMTQKRPFAFTLGPNVRWTMLPEKSGLSSLWSISLAAKILIRSF